MNETTQHTYESATARIEEIIRRLDSGEAGLRETLDLCKEGRELVEFCAGELDAVAQGLEELRLDELVARLEAGDRPGATAQGCRAQGAPLPGGAAHRGRGARPKPACPSGSSLGGRSIARCSRGRGCWSTAARRCRGGSS